MAAQMVRALTGDPASLASLRQRISGKTQSTYWMRSELYALSAQPTLRPLVEEAIADLLNNADPDLRAQGVTFLPAVRHSVDPLRKQILPFFDDPSPLVVHAALEIWSRSQSQYQPVLKLLGHPTASVREQTLQYLHQTSIPAEMVFESLRPCLEDESRRVRFTAARYLHDNSPECLALVLSQVPRDEQGQRIFHQADGQLTPLAESVTYICVTLFSNPQKPVTSHELMRALGSAVVPLLTNNIIMEKGPETSRIRHAMQLLTVEQRGRGLADALFQPDSQAWALRILGREPRECLAFVAPPLVEFLEAELRRNTPLTSRRIDLIAGVLSVLNRCGPLAADGVPVLTQMVAENKMKLGSLAAKVLGQIGPAAASALPQLEKAANSTDPLLAASAQTAIQLIRKQ